jgi:uncharacterized RDD family membrane protein YckC
VSTTVPQRARPYQGLRAGVVTRLVANFLDLLVVIGVLVAIYAAIAATLFLLHPSRFHWPERLGWTVPLVGGLVLIPYLALTWTTTGRTWGDAVLGLRVVDATDNPPHVSRALARAALCALVPIGLLWVAVSRKNRSMHDVLTRTSVVYDWGRHVPSN